MTAITGQSRFITLKQLKDHDACPEECRRFEKVFGTKARATYKNLEKFGLSNYGWIRDHLLTDKSRQKWWQKWASTYGGVDLHYTRTMAEFTLKLYNTQDLPEPVRKKK